jgi:hypothetical protein
MRAGRLADLRLDLVASDRVTASLQQVCEVRPALPPTRAGDGAPDLLLVESGSGARPEQIEAVAEAARRASCPAAIWLTRHEDVEGYPPELLALFDRVFVTDSLAVKLLMRRVEAPARILPLAMSAGPPGPQADGDRVGYVGGFSSAWSEGPRKLAEALLDAALPYGLEILPGCGDGFADLPERFRDCVREEDVLERSLEPLRACRALIVFVPQGRVPTVPAIALDALGMGMLLIMRSSNAWKVIPAKLSAYLSKPEEAAECIAWCMSDGEEQELRSRAARVAALHAHTAAARLATIASAVGMAVLPGAPLLEAVDGGLAFSAGERGSPAGEGPPLAAA